MDLLEPSVSLFSTLSGTIVAAIAEFLDFLRWAGDLGRVLREIDTATPGPGRYLDLQAFHGTEGFGSKFRAGRRW